MTKYYPATIIAGSVRVERRVQVNTYVTVQCGVCGHQIERCVSSAYEYDGAAGHTYDPKKTARCPSCNKLCSYEFAEASEASNVVPLRRAR